MTNDTRKKIEQFNGQALLRNLLDRQDEKDDDGMPVMKNIDKPNGGNILYLRYDAVVKEVNTHTKQILSESKQMKWTGKFTDEEIKAAMATRDIILKENVLELKSIYMAGEIVMWVEMQADQPNQQGCEQFAIGFAEWIWDERYVQYWGSDEPNNLKWYKSYTLPDRKYFTTDQLLQLYTSPSPQKTQTK